jgi:hypothetical protein
MSVHIQSMRWLICLAVMIACGCDRSAKQGSSSAGGSSEEGTGNDASDRKAPGGGKIIPINRDVKSLEGNWVMVVTTQRRDNYVWVLRLSRGADGQITGEFLDTTNDKLNPTLQEVTVNERAVRLVVKNSMATVDFRGTFDGRAVRGTLAGGPQELYPARLLSTDAESLKDYVVAALPPAADVFDKAINAMKNQPDPRAIVQIARDHRTSPVALDALASLMAMQAQMKFDDAVVREIADEYLETAKVWGPRMSTQAELMCAQQLIMSRRLPTEALKHLETAEQLLGSDATAWKQQIENLRQTAEIQVALEKGRSKASEDRAAAYTELQDALKRQPYNAEILLALATHAEATSQIDAAITYYSDIVALPLLEPTVLAQRAGQPAGDPTPSDALKKLWVERHGDDSKLDEHVAAVHRAKLDALLSEIREKAPPRPTEDAGDHTVLVEMFTGGQCAPCVAADIGLTALAETFPTSELIVVRYHQHIPGPDGLVNQDGEDRFSFYESGGTPTVAVDGLVLDPRQLPFAGPMQLSPSAYSTFRQFVDLRRKQSTPIRLMLDAAVVNGELAIQATVTGATEEQLPSLRLRLALVEAAVESRMPNGIRHHEMVVREMPGGARGVLPKKGELKYSYTMPVADLQQHLNEYISRYEAGGKLEFPAELKPPVRGPLSLVGWVQNDKFVVPTAKNDAADGKNSESRSIPLILQSAIVPVAGWPGAEAASTAPAESTQADVTSKPPAPALPE